MGIDNNRSKVNANHDCGDCVSSDSSYDLRKEIKDSIRDEFSKETKVLNSFDNVVLVQIDISNNSTRIEDDFEEEEIISSIKSLRI